MNRYTACLVKEIEELPDNFRPETIFFGGGTPSLLTAPQWSKILEALQRKNALGACEFTIECNPATVSLEKARLLRSFGVNRISMGVQSLNEDLLDRLGRVHSRAMVFCSYDLLRKAGFTNVNLDLMFAIPGQTLAVWQDTLREVIAMGSEHISTYEVIYEDDTPLFLDLQKGIVRENEDLACAMYEALIERVADAGFKQYEVANFARDPVAGLSETEDPAFACKHNLNYWKGGQFYGVGPSATSYVAGIRNKNLSNTQLYCEAIEQDRSPVDTSEQLEPLRRAGETAAFGLRMTRGWRFDLFKDVTGYDLRDEWLSEMRELESKGLAVIEPDRFRLNSKGLRFADAAAEMFLR